MSPTTQRLSLSSSVWTGWNPHGHVLLPPPPFCCLLRRKRNGGHGRGDIYRCLYCSEHGRPHTCIAPRRSERSAAGAALQCRTVPLRSPGPEGAGRQGVAPEKRRQPTKVGLAIGWCQSLKSGQSDMTCLLCGRTARTGTPPV